MTSPKDQIREAVWDRMEREGIESFPGARGRIPNFGGAAAAADRLAGTEAWRLARVLKCNPDAPQRPVRFRALEAGKTVFMAVPRLRELRCFVKLDPARIPRAQWRDAASIAGSLRYGVPVHPSDVPGIDLVIAGSVAVNARGERIGKGGGYSDLEWALGREFGFLKAATPVLPRSIPSKSGIKTSRSRPRRYGESHRHGGRGDFGKTEAAQTARHRSPPGQRGDARGDPHPAGGPRTEQARS